MGEDLKSKTQEWLKYVERFNRHKWPFSINETALLIIDMQNYFIGEGKDIILFKDGIVQNIVRLVEYFRKNSSPVMYTRHAHRPDGSDLGILKDWWDDMPVDGTKESEIIESLKPLGNEHVITKNRYSAFYKTDLEESLRRLNIKTVVITGIMTNICCESTARDAFFRDYYVKFVADATGTVKEEMHKGTLLNLAYAFADVTTTEMIIGGG